MRTPSATCYPLRRRHRRRIITPPDTRNAARMLKAAADLAALTLHARITRTRDPITGRIIQLSTVPLSKYEEITRPKSFDGTDTISASFSPSVNYDTAWQAIAAKAA